MKNSLQISLSRSSEVSDSEIEALKQNSWSCECPKMQLEQRVADSPKIYAGPGRITQDTQGVLRYQLYDVAPNEDRASTTREIWGLSRNEAGSLVPEKDYYDFSAIDANGRLWKSERLLLGHVAQTASGEVLVSGALAEIFCEGEIPEGVSVKGSSLQFLVCEEIKIPHNAHTSEHRYVAGWHRSHSYSLDAWRFRAAAIRFLLVDHQKSLEIRAATDEITWSPFMAERILESLFWVLGRPIHPTIQTRRCDRNTQSTIYSRRRPPFGARHNPPLSIELLISSKTNKITAEPYRKLFERYLIHTLQYEGPRHPIWAQLNAIYEASAGRFIDSQALTLAVCIESLVAQEFLDLGQPTNEDKSEVDKAIAFLKTWEGDSKLKDRIIGSVRGLKVARVGDRMRMLTEQGAISKQSAKAWQKLRNVNAHSYQSHSVSPEEFRNLLNATQVLFYQLVFHAIGYKGTYTNYSAIGWPNEHYPPKRAERGTGQEVETPE